jgi:L-alanine-DL-glutamate epimerase-like enolase superfamily enzyme
MKLKWKITPIILELKYDWKISRSSDRYKTNFFIEVTDGEFTGKGEAAPNKRFAENVDLFELQFNQMIELGLNNCSDLVSLKRVLCYPHFFKSLCLGIESCFIDYLSQRNHTTVATLLNVNEQNNVPTFYSIPILNDKELVDFYLENELWKFKFLKIKVSKSTAYSLLKQITQITSQPLVVDANEDWQNADDFLDFVEKIQYPNILFFEQPLPAYAVVEYQKLRKKLPFQVFADESFLRNTNWNLISDCFDGVNLKIMKIGSLVDSVDMLRKAKLINLKTMVGCMIETSLAINYGLYLADLADYIDLDGFLHLKEDPAKRLTCENGMIIRI